MSDLAQSHCEACRADAPRVSDQEARDLLAELSGWDIIQVGDVKQSSIKQSPIKQLQKSYQFPNFADALAFTNRVGAIAEQEGHHPDLLTTWGSVTVTWWSHKIKGLHRNDFVMAAKTDQISY